MGNTASFHNVTQVVDTQGGLLLDASTFVNMSTYGSLNLAFNTVWVVDPLDEETPIGPYEAAMPGTHYENLSGTWSGPVKDSGDDGTWHVMWNPEGSEGVNFTLVQFLDMNYGELDAFQRGFNQCLKKRLDEPGAKPLGDDPILSEGLERIEVVLGQLV